MVKKLTIWIAENRNATKTRSKFLVGGEWQKVNTDLRLN
jgi:hypothetical protein